MKGRALIETLNRIDDRFLITSNSNVIVFSYEIDGVKFLDHMKLNDEGDLNVHWRVAGILFDEMRTRHQELLHAVRTRLPEFATLDSLMNDQCVRLTPGAILDTLIHWHLAKDDSFQVVKV